MLAGAARHRGASADVVVDLDVGGAKTGQEPGEPAAKFAKWITETDGLRFRGIQGYEGHLQISTPDFNLRKTKTFEALGKITATISRAQGARDHPGDSNVRRDGHVQHLRRVPRRDRHPAGLLHLHGPQVWRDRVCRDRLREVHDRARDGDQRAHSY